MIYEMNYERELVCFWKVIKSIRNYCKLKILGYQSEISILIKNSVWNIEKRALKE